jgi:hypothetical protein
MSIKTSESGTALRSRFTKSIVLAIRNLMGQSQPDASSLDMAAYIVLALEKIAESVDRSAEAWEKRNYWLKADQFRQEYLWIEPSLAVLKPALLAEDWVSLVPELVQVAQRLKNVKIAQNHRIGTPWIGAWDALRKTSKS